ncbi:uncharacterized protein LOC115232616 isoform X1 [Octopus sinensis]|uniref:Uncharacterized protein LOC115232616 isoform X1 n=1 Tax=Octopus sinensis TaxID=2607531 RepID=A0A6P7U7W3_9MOLL|nr:uncharacterized protein LOC115232616 isoform X1 [Octopus sinensis]
MRKKLKTKFQTNKMLRKATSKYQVGFLWKQSNRDGHQIPGFRKTNPSTSDSLQVKSGVKYYTFYNEPKNEANNENSSKTLKPINSSSCRFDNIGDSESLSFKDNHRSLRVSNNNRCLLNPNDENFYGFRNKNNLRNYKNLQFVKTVDCTLDVSANQKEVEKSSDNNRHSGYSKNRKNVSFISLNQTAGNYSKQPWYVPNFDYCLSKASEGSKIDILRASSPSKQRGSLKNFKKIMRPSLKEVEANVNGFNIKRISNEPRQSSRCESAYPQKHSGQSLLNCDISTANNAFANHNRKRNEDIKEKSLNKPFQVFTDVSSAATKDSDNKRTKFKSNTKYARKYSFQQLKMNSKLYQNKLVLTKTEKNNFNETVNANNIIQNKTNQNRDFSFAESEKNRKRPERRKFEDNEETVTANYISRGYLKPDTKPNLFELTGLKLPLQMSNKTFIPYPLKYFKNHSLQATQTNTSRIIGFNRSPALLTIKNIVLHDAASRQSKKKELKENNILKWLEDCSKVLLDTSFSHIF